MTLDEIEACNTPNWDGEGAHPITPEAVSTARALMALPWFCDSGPDVCPHNNGLVTFDWERQGHDIYLEVGKTTAGFYARLPDDHTAYWNGPNRAEEIADQIREHVERMP